MLRSREIAVILEAALAELDDTNDRRTARLSFEGATPSGLLGDGGDPSALASSLAPADRLKNQLRRLIDQGER